jgi:phage baseplate assembly protein W
MSMIEIAFPYGLDDRGRTATATYGDHVEQMLELLLLTRPGERVNLPTFGCGLLDQAFAPNSPEIAAALNVTIAAAINLWLQDVVSVTSLNATAQDGQLIVNIAYTVLPTGSPASLTLSVPGGP